MNAFNAVLGVGRGLDDFLTGGTGQRIASGIKDRNAFRGAQEAIGAGNFDRAQQLVDSRSDPREILARQNAADAQSRQHMLNIASFVDGLPEAQQLDFIQKQGPLLRKAFGLDDEDMTILGQTVGTPGGFAALANAAISPQQQFDNRIAQGDQQEEIRANQATESLRSREADIAQQNANTNEFKARAPKTGGRIVLPDGTVVETGPTPQDDARRRIESRGQRTQLITEKFDEAIDQVSPTSAGLAGPTALIPGTPARNLSATIDTIRANIGFEELQAMRDASPTGGALGQVTEREIAFLQSVLGSLDQSQSPEQLKANLARAKREVLDSWGRVMSAYEQDFGVEYQGPGSLIADDTPSAGVDDDETNALLQKYGVIQ